MIAATLPLVAVLIVAGPAPDDRASGTEVKVTQKSLQPLCLDGAAVKAGQRRWRLAAGEHALAFTMRNRPRTGVAGSDVAPGVAVVRFTPEAGHKYEVEVRAPATTFSTRVWERGGWKPVVRDRTVDHVASSDPEWTESACPPSGN